VRSTRFENVLTRLILFEIIVIEDAEMAGLLRPHTGSRIFEGTVGSTGISIATLAKARYVSLSHTRSSVLIRERKRL
jgi:cysteine synthase